MILRVLDYESLQIFENQEGRRFRDTLPGKIKRVLYIQRLHHVLDWYMHWAFNISPDISRSLNPGLNLGFNKTTNFVDYLL